MLQNCVLYQDISHYSADVVYDNDCLGVWKYVYKQNTNKCTETADQTLTFSVEFNISKERNTSDWFKSMQNN